MCERSGEVASYVVARYYEVEKGENHEMVEGMSWMVRWKAGGKAVSAGPQSRRGSKSSRSERASGNSHPCPMPNPAVCSPDSIYDELIFFVSGAAKFGALRCWMTNVGENACQGSQGRSELVHSSV